MAGSAGDRVGVFGGTFDPVHIGHLLVACYALDALQLDKVLFVPAGRPPHKPGQIVSSDEDRLAMLALAIEGRAGFEVSLADLRRDGPSYSVDLLSALRHAHSQDEMYFIIGADSLRDFHLWRQPTAIANIATIVVAGRPGVELDIAAAVRLTPALERRVVGIETPLIEISATSIRERVRDGSPIWYQTPEPVEHYISGHGLYRTDQR
ncbi:nicotinate-nucleotide adenylyltransferase [soil metagenome]